ncbi:MULTISPECIES: preprotein translocase subunit SecE [Actinosynnema]|uniref:Protein translocase subunit SecE n=1 Tax=Actinosynnema pretiosum TaxID=42197 RepID=A0A290ZEN3_9PSEU|nr:preprotein translocase subunit SecE [Actinosynnema pretiosum]ATE57467.1 preprotein translocase subunit SecE [Actinosynnema pretiosum]
MSEGREQGQPEKRDDASRPVTAAARRERRGTARPASRKDAGRSAEPKSDKVDSTSDSAKKGKPTRSREGKEKRPNIFARFFRYIREVVGELRKVIWPTRKQMVTYTSVVLVFVAFMTALVFGLDIAFAEGVFWLFG